MTGIGPVGRRATGIVEATIYSNGTYLRNNPSWHAGDAAWKAGHVLRMLERHKLRPASVVEIGCGSGEMVRELARGVPGAKFVGCEISPDAFRICGAKAGQRTEFRLGPGLDDPERFDLALAIDVFEHVEDCFAFLRAMRAKGEHKIYHIPLDLSALAVARPAKLMALRRQVGHIHYFTKDTALALLEETGHRVVDHFYTSGATELDPQGWKPRLMRGPRNALYKLAPDAAARILGGYSLLVLAR
jgi:SAM-dependent methyltransferase